jgi:ribosomal protein S18 acetylase RimI-like enzyme
MIDISLHIRPFEPSDGEYEAVARVAAAYGPDMLGDYEYAKAERVRALDQSFAGGEYLLRRYVAEVGGSIAGYTQLFHIPWLREPGRYWSAIRVHPAQGRRGIGGQLYNRLLAELRQLGATATWSEVHELMPETVARVERLGFRELFRSWPFSLDTNGFDIERLRPALSRTAGRGITIATLAQELERDPESLSKLYDLHVAITREIPIPGQPHPAPGLGWFERYALGTPLSLPDAYFIAKDGERYVGESFLRRVERAPAELSVGATGIHGQYRGYGIAVALKIQTIAYAIQHGYTRIWTGVESNNPGMLAINAKLGFMQGPGVIVFEKEMRDERLCLP